MGLQDPPQDAPFDEDRAGLARERSAGEIGVRDDGRRRRGRLDFRRLQVAGAWAGHALPSRIERQTLVNRARAVKSVKFSFQLSAFSVQPSFSELTAAG